MRRNELQRFARAVIKFLADKPKSKWTAFAHVWDRAIVVLASTWIAVTAFMNNQAGTLLVIVTLVGFMFFGLWLVSRGR